MRSHEAASQPHRVRELHSSTQMSPNFHSAAISRCKLSGLCRYWRPFLAIMLIFTSSSSQAVDSLEDCIQSMSPVLIVEKKSGHIFREKSESGQLAHVIEYAHFAPGARIFRNNNVWNKRQQNQVRKKIQTDKRSYTNQYFGDVQNMKSFLGNSLYAPLAARISELTKLISIPSNMGRLKIRSIAIHLENARTFTFWHVHAKGEITLALSEEGSLTDIEGFELLNNDGQASAIFTDRVYHRPSLSDRRLIVFVSMHADNDPDLQPSFRATLTEP